MSRRAIVWTSATCAAILLGACSLTVSTSGLSGGADPSLDGGAAMTDGAVAGEGGSVEASVVDAALDAPHDPSLLGEYSFEDPSGFSVHDSSGNGHDGLIQAAATFVADGARGRALAVDSTGFFVVDGLSAGQFPHSGTLSLWFRFDFAPDSIQGRSVFDDWDDTRTHLFVRRGPSAPPGEFQMALQGASSQYAVAASFVTVRNTWTHVVMTWDEATSIGALYADRMLLHRGSYAMPFVLGDGQRFRFGEGLIGGIDEVRLYSRALTGDEVTKLD
ncbi:MAG: hypothetical protein JWO86_7396 [Myxococcaceae bacterium]|nr:hypothetical protein [Myxococcaceae bacterium]